LPKYSERMGLPKGLKTSHGGAKNSSAKDGWWGSRFEAKLFARKARRREDRASVESGGKQGYKRLFGDVRAILNRHDPMGLIAHGFPEDEYEPEVGAILPRLVKAGSVADAETIVSDVFLEWFSETLPPELVSAIGADVWAALLHVHSTTAR
jgi:hypothetical protein